MSADQLPDNELSRIIPKEALVEGPVDLDVTATAAERQALARRFGFLEIESLEAKVRLKPRAKGALVTMTAELSAVVVQPCVQSLDPVRGELRESVEQLFSLTTDEAEVTELVIDPNEPDPPEPIGPEGLEIGEILAQHLAISVDPYPRHPDTGPLSDGTGGKSTADDEPASPFAVLKVLKEGA